MTTPPDTAGQIDCVKRNQMKIIRDELANFFAERRDRRPERVAS